MRFAQWEPCYRSIVTRFGFSVAREEASADWLARALSAKGSYGGRRAGVPQLRALLAGRDAVVLGRAKGPLPSFPWRDRRVVVACDGATSACLAQGLVPDLVVTDLDGRLSDEVRANRLGSLLVIQAHGDNLPTLRHWLGRFPGPVVGSCSARPRGPLVNFGGFTDGDRAVLLAEALGARSATLVRFDFDHPAEGPGPAGRVKREKLEVARQILAEVQTRGKLNLSTYPDRSLLDPPLPGKGRPSGQVEIRSRERPRRASPPVRPHTRARSPGR
jgi:uncharacterized Rossmann fold enzyme